MQKLITVISLGLAVGATGTAAVLYSDLHPGWWRGGPNVAVASPSPPRPLPVPLLPPARTAEQKAQDAIYTLKIRQSRDDFLTGDPNGRAEWAAPDKDDYPTLCGITPQGRYYVSRTQYGSSRHDEPPDEDQQFNHNWAQIGCEKTSPAKQPQLVHDQLTDEHYDNTHPVNADCLMMQIHAAANHDAVAEKRWADDPHYCRNGHYERDQAGH